MPPLDETEREAFLTATDQEPWGRCTAEIGTVTPEGRPYVTPVWYEYEDEAIYVLGKPAAQYVRNVRENPAVHVVVDKASPPYVRVNVQGTAEIVAEEWSPRWEALSERLAEAYLGEAGPEYHEDRLAHDVVVLEVTPERLNSWRVGDSMSRTFHREAAWNEQ
jgi:PPOX class probable F420-dependent enzyme